MYKELKARYHDNPQIMAMIFAFEDCGREGRRLMVALAVVVALSTLAVAVSLF